MSRWILRERMLVRLGLLQRGGVFGGVRWQFGMSSAVRGRQAAPSRLRMRRRSPRLLWCSRSARLLRMWLRCWVLLRLRHGRLHRTRRGWRPVRERRRMSYGQLQYVRGSLSSSGGFDVHVERLRRVPEQRGVELLLTRVLGDGPVQSLPVPRARRFVSVPAELRRRR